MTNYDVFDSFLKELKEWSNHHQSFIKGVAVVGSYARGDFHSESDVDLIIIGPNKELILKIILDEFIYEEMNSYQFEEWGILTSLRILYINHLEVEFGVVTESWINEPLDEGTKEVVKNGFRIVLDKENIFYHVLEFLKSEEATY